MDEIQTFCNNVRILRKSRKITRKEMCAALKIGMKTLNKIESGVLPPKLSCDVIYRLSVYFDVTPKELFSPLPEYLKKQ